MKRHLAALLLLASTQADAQVRPQQGRGDARLQQVDYRADQIVLIEAAPGYEVTLELAPDEQIQSVALGDSGSWQATADHAGNHLFLKPLTSTGGTNMTVRTNVRMYAFDLVALPAPSPTMPYVVTFRYPAAATVTAPDKPAGDPIGRYKVTGSAAVKPAGISDDGNHTSIEWSPSTPLPAVYILDAAGKEALANGFMRDGLYVIDSVNQRLVFRLDKQVARADRVVIRPKPHG